jgi:outer membrane protein assembly factor BamB
MNGRLLSFGILLVSVGTGLVVATRPAVAAEPQAADWSNWRGPQQNRSATDKHLIDSWDPDGGPESNLIWKNTELGGRSTPIVMGGKLFTIVRASPGTAEETEMVVCVDAATGKKIWQYRMNVYLCEVPKERVGWSSCAGDPETSRIYVQSVSGYFCCLDAATGGLVWERSLLEEFGLINTFGGRTNVPVVFEDLVITSAVVVGWGDSAKYNFLARPAHRFMALDKATGELRWINGTNISPFDTTYSTPTVCVLGGQAALVFGSGDGQVWAIQPRTGKHIWHYPLSSKRGLSVSPLVVGDTVYMGHSEENLVGNTMGAVVSLDGTLEGDLTDKEKWLVPELMAGKSSPVMIDGILCVVDDRAKLYILDPETGERISRKALGTAMRSTPLVADGKLYLCTSSGRWYILQPTDSGVEILHKLRQEGDASDGSPIASQGRIYFPTSAAIYCLGNPNIEPTADPLPELPQETPDNKAAVPVQIQVVPFDALLSTGQTQDYKVRLFNSRGQLLREAAASEVSFSIDGPGAISPTGQYTSPEENSHQTSLVVCKVGELTGTARIRVVPPLPWSFDFSKAEKVPLTWIGGRVRYEIREQDGERFAVKRSVLPTPRNPVNKLGTRSQLSMGPVDLDNYTIQADFAADEQNSKMPDFGLTNSRYSMTLRSSVGELRIYSWSPHEHRTYASVAFQLKPHQWYTMKLRVDPNENQATIRGKLWPRGTDEPDEWTIEMVDASPNLHGSPGLFGKAEAAEIFVDNIRVYANQ